jgi:hypothetical protein
LKGEERVCHVTEADRPRGAAPFWRSKASPVGSASSVCAGLSEKCLHVRPLGIGGLAPVRGGVMRRFRGGTLVARQGNAGIKRK